MSKLENIILNAKDDILDMDAGIMISDWEGVEDVLNYLILEYTDRYEVYLHLNDDFRDVLVKGVSHDLEDAKEIATFELYQKMNNYH